MDTRYWFLVLLVVLIIVLGFDRISSGQTQSGGPQTYTLYPIGNVMKEGGRTFIVLDKKYEPGLIGLDKFSHVTVVYWFDRNDTPRKRSILQVHPQGNKTNPLRGVFATHSPVRPNLIAISRCKIISVEGNIIEVDGIDAFDDSPVIDLKN